MAHEKTIHPREWSERMGPVAWMTFAAAAVAAGKQAGDASKMADAMTSQAQQRFVRTDVDEDRD